mgnify:FL=1
MTEQTKITKGAPLSSVQACVTTFVSNSKSFTEVNLHVEMLEVMNPNSFSKDKTDEPSRDLLTRVSELKLKLETKMETRADTAKNVTNNNDTLVSVILERQLKDEDVERKKRAQRIAMMHSIINLCDSNLVTMLNNDELKLMQYIHNGEIKNFWKRFLEIILIDNYNGKNRGDQLTMVQRQLGNLKKNINQSMDVWVKEFKDLMVVAKLVGSEETTPRYIHYFVTSLVDDEMYFRFIQDIKKELKDGVTSTVTNNNTNTNNTSTATNNNTNTSNSISIESVFKKAIEYESDNLVLFKKSAIAPMITALYSNSNQNVNQNNNNNNNNNNKKNYYGLCEGYYMKGECRFGRKCRFKHSIREEKKENIKVNKNNIINNIIPIINSKNRVEQKMETLNKEINNGWNNNYLNSNIFNNFDISSYSLSCLTASCLSPDYIYLYFDSCADGSVCCDERLLNFKYDLVDLSLGGIVSGNGKIIGIGKGIFPFDGINFYYSPGANRNILSDKDAKEYFFINRDNVNNKYLLKNKTSGKTIQFCGDENGFFVFKLKVTNNNNIKNDQNGELFSKIDNCNVSDVNVNITISGVSDLMRLHQQLNYSDINNILLLYKNGKIKCEQFNKLFNEFKESHGSKCLGCLLGKFQDIPHPKSESIKPSKPGELLQMDLYYIGSDTWGNRKKMIMMLVVDAFSLHRMTIFLNNKSKEEIRRALDEVEAVYGLAGLKIQEIRSDLESGLRALEIELNKKGIRLSWAAKGHHAYVAEAIIKSMKNSFRSTIHGITQYKVPAMLYPYVISMVINSRNIGYSYKNKEKTINEIFFGKSDNFDSLGKVGPFGTVVVCLNVFDDSTIPDHKSRGRWGIIVGRASNLNGDALIFFPDTKRVVIRSIWKEVECTEEFKKELENLDKSDPNISIYDIYNRRILDTMEYETLEEDEVIGSIMQVESQNSINVDQPNIEKNNKNNNIEFPVIPIVNEFTSPITTLIKEKQESKSANNDENNNNKVDLISENDNNIINKNELKVENEHQNQVSNIDKKKINNKNNKITKSGREIKIPVRFKENIKRVNAFNTNITKMDSERKKVAEKVEMKALAIDKETFKYMTWEEVKKLNVRILPTSTVFTEKLGPNGEHIKDKARFVVCGNYALEIDPNDTYASTAAINTLKIALSVAAIKGLTSSVMDIGNAFVCSEMTDEDIYIRINKNTVQSLIEVDPSAIPFVSTYNGEIFAKLKKWLYGLRNSPAHWYENISEKFISMGYKRSQFDNCLFVRMNGNDYSIIIIHVDDILLLANTEEEHKRVKELLIKAFINVTVKRDRKFTFLGNEIEFLNDGDISFNNKKKLKDIISDNNIMDFSTIPCTMNLHVRNSDSQKLNKEDNNWFHSTIMRIMFVATRSRSYDLLMTTSVLATRVKDANQQDKEHLLRLLRYINKTLEYNIIFKKDAKIKLEGYSDASFSCYDDCKSQSAFAIFVTNIGSAVLIKSYKEKLIGLSSMESELAATNQCYKELLWTRDLMNELGFDISIATLYTDNKASIAVINNPNLQNKRNCKYINRHLFGMSEKVLEGILSVQYCSTEDMPVDPCTKPMSGVISRKHYSRLSGNNISEIKNIKNKNNIYEVLRLDDDNDHNSDSYN